MRTFRQRLGAFLAAVLLGGGSIASLPVATPLAAVGVAIAIDLASAQPAEAGAMSNYLVNKDIDYILRAQTFTAPTTAYIGLATTTGSAAACGTEVATGSYARVAVTSSLANWAGTQSAGSTTASSGTSGQTSNNAAITFPAPTANWGTITSFCMFDASTSGNLLLQAALTTSKTVNNGDAAPSFAIAALTWTISQNLLHFQLKHMHAATFFHMPGDRLAANHEWVDNRRRAA